MKNIFNPIIILLLVFVLGGQSCTLFEVEDDTITDSCQSYSRAGTTADIEFLDFENLGATYNCNELMRLVFFKDFLDVRGTDNSPTSNSRGIAVSITIRTSTENVLNNGAYILSENDAPFTIEEIEFLDINDSTTEYSEAQTATLNVQDFEEGRSFSLDAELEDGTSLSLCFNGLLSNEVIRSLPRCPDNLKITYQGNPVNLTKGYWLRNGTNSSGNYLYRIILCSEDVNLENNFDWSSFTGTGDILTFEVYHTDSELPESESFDYWNTNGAGNAPGINNNVQIAFDYNGSIGGEIIFNEIDVTDGVYMVKSCDEFFITLQLKNFDGSIRCFSGNLIEL